VQREGNANAAKEAHKVFESCSMPFEVDARGLLPRCVDVDSHD
jgi:hypothetical protein